MAFSIFRAGQTPPQSKAFLSFQREIPYLLAITPLIPSVYPFLHSYVTTNMAFTHGFTFLNMEPHTM